MFKQNKYTKIYTSLIEKAKSRELVPKIVEKHHIIPKSLGGNNLKDNIVKLTPREHFIAHALLVKMVITENHKRAMSYAFSGMGRSNSEYNRIGNGKLYEKIQISIRPLYSGKNSVSYGRKNTQEHKDLMSKVHKGKTLSDEHKSILRNLQLGRKHPSNICNKISEGVSRTWKIIHPDGREEIIQNLKKFCKCNNLNLGHMSSVSSKKRKHHRGYKVEKL